MSHFLLMHGARKNAGDFLIRERGRALLSRVHPDIGIRERPRWEALRVDELRDVRTIVLCGGPAYQPDFYPQVIPLLPNLEQIEPLVVPLGLGLGVGLQKEDLDEFSFTPSALAALRWIHDRIGVSSVRDDVTARVLRDRGGVESHVTGCPAWFYLPDLDRSFHAPAVIRRVVVTPPAAPKLLGQSMALLRLVARRYPRAERHLVFHRGILPDRFTSPRPAAMTMGLAAAATVLGYRWRDASFGTSDIDFYGACDLHVGYRVHAHIDFLSRRRPSLLLCEDIRGVGQSQTLQTGDVDARSPDAVHQVDARLDTHERSLFRGFEQTVDIMRAAYAETVRYLRAA